MASIAVIEPAAGTSDAVTFHRRQIVHFAEFTQALVPCPHRHEMGCKRRSSDIEQRFGLELGIGLE
jgi:hypothetical protein